MVCKLFKCTLRNRRTATNDTELQIARTHALSRNFIHMTVAVNDRKHCGTFNSTHQPFALSKSLWMHSAKITLAFASLPFSFDTDSVSLTPCDGIIVFSLYWFFSQLKSSVKYHFFRIHLHFCFACRHCKQLKWSNYKSAQFAYVIKMNFGVKIFTQTGQGSSQVFWIYFQVN